MKTRVIIVCMLLCCNMAACGKTRVVNNMDLGNPATELLLSDMSSITNEITKLFEYVNPEILHYTPDMYVAFADIDDDNIPELFYGYHTYTASHSKIWYKIYSLSDHRNIEVTRAAELSTYLSDSECAFFSGHDGLFGGIYYVDENGQKYWLTTANVGAAAHPETDTDKLWFNDGKLYAESNCYDKSNFEMPSDKQYPLAEAYGIIDIENIEESICGLLDQYLKSINQLKS